jgi:excinuclease ABC subunit B
LSYFPKDKNGKPDFVTIIDESHIAIPQIHGMYRGDRSRKKTLIEYGWRLPSALDNRPLKFDEFLSRVGSIIFTSATPSDYEKKHSSKVVKQIIRPTYLLDPKIEIQPIYNRKTKVSQIDHLLKQVTEINKKGERALVNALTKKMAEELADFFNGKNIKSKFMHSDTKTLERAEILTDFRKGKFNVLVGVNLLREGLDMPEVSLVAILESDQEGFLRSETSFIQTMGRASRNLNGRVILYADKITGSMKRAIDVVEKRREVQQKYNIKNHKKPVSIIKKVNTLIELTDNN